MSIAKAIPTIQEIEALHPDMLVRGSKDLVSRDVGSDTRNFGARLMAMPGNVDALCALVRHCHAAGIPIVTHGGRTGLVAGTISEVGSIIVSTERLNNILEIDTKSGYAVVEAGVNLQKLQEAAARNNLEPGIDIGARGTATIGGMISTNAGGIQAFRYGVMRHRILGLEAVMADGQVMTDLTKVVKSTCGYDMKQLLIGSEGTLGIVTKAVVALSAVPKTKALALVALSSFDTVHQILERFSSASDATLIAAEILCAELLQMNAAAHGTSLPDAFFSTPLCMLIEVSAATHEMAEQSLEDGLAALWEPAKIVDVIIARSLSQAEQLWHLREDTSVFPALYPGYLSFDISIPTAQAPAYIARLQAALDSFQPGLSALYFGHIADGNLHIIPKRGDYDEPTKIAIQDLIYRDLTVLGGAISAEHGIGHTKRDALERFGDPFKLHLMGQIKKTLDPKNILNPGNVFRLEAVL